LEVERLHATKIMVSKYTDC